MLGCPTKLPEMATNTSCIWHQDSAIPVFSVFWICQDCKLQAGREQSESKMVQVPTRPSGDGRGLPVFFKSQMCQSSKQLLGREGSKPKTTWVPQSFSLWQLMCTVTGAGTQFCLSAL